MLFTAAGAYIVRGERLTALGFLGAACIAAAIAARCVQRGPLQGDLVAGHADRTARAVGGAGIQRAGDGHIRPVPADEDAAVARLGMRRLHQPADIDAGHRPRRRPRRSPGRYGRAIADPSSILHFRVVGWKTAQPFPLETWWQGGALTPTLSRGERVLSEQMFSYISSGNITMSVRNRTD